MPAISFQKEWLDMLLSSSKKQTTRKQTDRYKVGDVVNIYIQQRGRITSKPIRELTSEGKMMVSDRLMSHNYPYGGTIPQESYFAHFIGQVRLKEVYDFIPRHTSRTHLTEWALADGFDSFESARCWFEIRYGAKWMQRTWTVLKWNGWLARYFQPEVVE